MGRGLLELLVVGVVAGLVVGCEGANDPAGAVPAAAGEGEGEGKGREPAGLVPDFEHFQVAFQHTSRDWNQLETQFLLAGPISPELAVEWHEDGSIPGRDDELLITPLTGHSDAEESAWHAASTRLSHDGRFAAWPQLHPDTGRWELWAAQVDPGWTIRLDQKRRAASAGEGRLDTRSSGFAGEWLVYGVVTGDVDTIRAQVAFDGTYDHLVQALPLGSSAIIGPDGIRVVTLELTGPTSLSVWSAALSGEDDPVLLHAFEAEGVHTGAQYSGSERGALSRDGRYVALVTGAQERPGVQAELLVHVLATDPREPGGGHLDSTSLGPAGRGRCTIPREPGQYVDVHEPPVWSPDRRHLYLLASAPAHCGRRSYSVDDTAVLRLDVAEDGQLGEITNLTPIPPDWDHPRRMAISDLKLSPDGKVLVVVATSPHSVRSQDLFLASARMDEVYWEQLGMNPDATLLDSTVRLTTLARSGASLRGAFPLR